MRRELHSVTANPFETLGIAPRFTLAPSELEQRHRDLSRALHPDRYVSAPISERKLALERAVAVNDAFRTLRDSLTRAQQLLSLHGAAIQENERAAPALLMEIIELREDLEAARGHSHRIAALRTRVAEKISLEEHVLATVFDAGTLPSAADLGRARDATVKLRYFRRFEEEADMMEDETSAV
jgi:molecular chaperone HscB